MNPNPTSNRPLNQPIVIENEKRSGLFGKIAAGTLVAAAMGGLWFQGASVRDELARTKQDMTSMRGQMDQNVQEARTKAEAEIARVNERLATEISATQAAAKSQAARSEAAVRKQTTKQLAALSEQNELLSSQVNTLQKDAEDNSSKVTEALTGIQGDVGTVKTEVAAAKTEIDKTIADLHRVNGDMGVMSGLIATNASELEALRQLGEREYFEFTLNKGSQTPQKVGSIQLALKKADTKRSRFTLDVIADDRRIEKKDRSMNEPVQFYTSQARTPFEVVINDVSKDKVSGYLSVPKVKLAGRK
eukprot:TRINITY_DN2805_c0_g1_i6.p1 TRINITY_DN2805_c0_g1~~TRINITY_DN2805_c0_g1_i6.p1  ORF type:complete len:304 (-),score=74.15 TRINITY_DN2805_c0_g1_i6:94-1005(-)